MYRECLGGKCPILSAVVLVVIITTQVAVVVIAILVAMTISTELYLFMFSCFIITKKISQTCTALTVFHSSPGIVCIINNGLRSCYLEGFYLLFTLADTLLHISHDLGNGEIWEVMDNVSLKHLASFSNQRW